MRVLTAPQGWYPDDINSKLNFDEFASEGDEEGLFVGISCTEDINIVRYLSNFKRKVYINLEHPCTLYTSSNPIGLNPIQQQLLFDEVYTICPYSAEWLNGLDLPTKFVAMPYPHNLIYNKFQGAEKKYDVAYCGLIHSDEIASYIESISDTDYFFSTIKHYNRVPTVNHLATHDNIPNVDKWGVLAQSRTAIIQNNLYLKPEQIEIIKTLPSWQDNEAFSHAETGLLPQLKSRTVESALCKALMLVKKDPWNVIEEWFVADEDFVYFEDAKDLKEKVIEINKNWSKYEQMTESAYNKVVEKYNTKYIFEKIKNKEEIK